jgi:hypothetical protein
MIPNFENLKFVDENGMLTDTWRQTMSGLITQLQKTISKEGLVVPQQTSSNIAILNNIKSLGALLYDQNTNQLKVNISGAFSPVVHGNSLNDTTNTPLMNFASEIQPLHNATGSNTPTMGTNSPATDPSTPYTWVKILAADGTTCYLPAWK